MQAFSPSKSFSAPVQLGLRENARPFAWLVLINAFVGAMVGLERSLFPDFAREAFGVETATAVLSFIAVFGLFKAAANYFAGRWAQRLGRKALLVAGWVLMIPVPLLLFWAPSWTVVVAANALLGAGQGLAWSSTVVMKIDLVGPKQRGWAMGINEFAGYVAVGVVALLSTYAAEFWGTRWVLLSGVVLAVVGLAASWLLVPDTRAHAALEAAQTDTRPTSTAASLFWDTTWRNPQLRALTQAGLVNNLNDGMVWGLFPLFLAQAHATPQSVGWIVGIYPMVWGLGQLLTGRWGDRMPKRRLLFWGMALQGVVLLAFPSLPGPWAWGIAAAALGWGTALVYPTFLSSLSDVVSPQDRAASVGIFRLWRDLGYVVGALGSGWIADRLGVPAAIGAVGALTLASALPFARLNAHHQG